MATSMEMLWMSSKPFLVFVNINFFVLLQKEKAKKSIFEHGEDTNDNAFCLQSLFGNINYSYYLWNYFHCVHFFQVFLIRFRHENFELGLRKRLSR